VGWGVAAVVATLLLTILPADLTADPEFISKARDSIIENGGTVALTQSGLGLPQLYQAAWPGADAWRLLFFLGPVPAVLVFFVRRFVDEPAVFVDTQKNLARASRKANFLEIFSSPPMARRTILTCLVATGAHGGYWAIMTWLPTFLRTERHLTVLGTGE